ncbi:translocation/assembly module TamB domain-containing protein [Pendulispora albinea]|uniref:Translocation/assembly module TamB n=1 Tax=Pendulispora albinea TaxID=2741071 RepID=A0ABZ2M872_9BACT
MRHRATVQSAKSAKPRSRARRVLGVIGKVVGTTVTLAGATCAGILLHLDRPATRRVAASQLNALLASTFKGRIAIENVAHLGLDGVRGVRVRITDPNGTQVLYADDVSAELSAIAVAKSALFGKGDIDVAVRAVDVAYLDVNVDEDQSPEHTMRLLRALESKDTSPPAPEDPTARGLRLSFPRIVLTHGWVHGTMAGAPALDVDADGLGVRVLVAPKETRVDLDRAQLTGRGMPNHLDPHGEAEFHLVTPSAGGKGVDLTGRFGGDVGGVPAVARATMNGDRLDAVLDVPQAEAERLRPLFDPSPSPLREPFAAHAEVHGDMPSLKATAALHAGRGAVDVAATIGLDPDKTHIVAHIDAHDVDIRAFSETAPASRLAAASDIEVNIGPAGALSGTYTFALAPGSVGTNPVPAAQLRGKFTEASARVEGTIAERGAPVALEATMQQIGDRHRVDFSVSSKVPALERIPRLEAMSGQNLPVTGAAVLRATGTVDVEGARLDARLEANATNVVYGDTAKVARAAIRARATGALSAPMVGATVQATDVVAGEYAFHDVRAGARLDVANMAVEGARVSLVRQGVTLDARVAKVAAAHGALKVDGLVIDGLGAPANASFVKTARGLTVHAKTDGLDLAKVARFLEVQDQVSHGTLAFAIDANLAKGASTGKVELGLREATVSKLRNGNMELVATLDDEDLAVALRADLAEAGHLSLQSSGVKLGSAKGPLDPAAWTNAIGRAAIEGELDLEKIASLLPPRALPFGEVKGFLSLEGTLRRDSAKVAPEVALSTQTRGLVLTGPAPEEPPPVGSTRVLAPPPWRSNDVDAGFNVRVDATSGHAEVTARLTDKHGLLANFDMKADIPYNELWTDPDKGRAAAELEKAPFEARLSVPRRKLSELPAVLQTAGMPGALELDLTAAGRATAPRVQLAANLRDDQDGQGSSSPLVQATSTDLLATYDGQRADASVRMQALRGAGPKAPPAGELLAAEAHAKVAIEDLIHPAPGRELPWDANLRAKLSSFPLEILAPLSAMPIRGRIHGEITVDGLHQDAKARARIDVERLMVGEAKYKGGFIQASAGGNAPAEAVVRLDQDDGFLEARARAGAQWGARVAPELDPTQPLEASVSARHFRAAALEPFLAGAVADLDGYLDARAQAKLDPRTRDAKLSGSVAFRHGVVNIPALGEELHGVRATVRLSEDGRVRVDDVVARGTEGKVSANAEAKLAGLSLVEASGKVHISEREAMPFALQGQPVGTVFGDVRVALKTAPNGRDKTMTVDIPSFHTKLPPTGGNSVQDLEARDDIRVGVERERDKLTRLALDQEDYENLGNEDQPKEPPPILNIDVHLGDVEIRRSTDVKVGVTGNPKIQVGEKTEMSGQLRLTGGFIELQGKKLEIEHGTVTFVGEPSNPELVVTARWNAPDGTLVYADFVGPLETGKVNLRSEPPRPKNEIMALLMFGTAEGSQSTPYPQRQPDGTVRAVGMGGAYVAQGANKAIEDLAGTDRITAHIDTTQSANPRPELEFQLSRSLSVKLGRALGIPPLDRPDRNFLIIGWRVKRNWTLETTFGDRGTSIVDGVWQRRY